jgi:hypothetical protein
MQVVGVEVAKTSIVVCQLDTPPTNIAKAARSYKPQKLAVSRESVDRLCEMGDLFVIEPTGIYSKIWLDQLEQRGKDIRRVSPRRVKNLRLYHDIQTKSDRYDAFFLALYGLLNHHDPAAWLDPHAEDLRDLVLKHQALSKLTGGLCNRLWQSLAVEWPESCTSKSGKKPKVARIFGEADPPAPWRFIAGEKVRGATQRQARLNDTIGAGLSDLTRTLARQVCDLERQQFEIEQQIMILLQQHEFQRYHAIFDQFGFGPMTRAVLLSRIFPIERFLGHNGRPTIEWVHTDKGKRSRRHRSLNKFRLALGLGTVVYQSGTKSQEKPGGPTYARSAMFLHVKSAIVIPGSRALAGPRYLASHARYYSTIPPEVPHKIAVMRTASKIAKDLFRALLP